MGLLIRGSYYQVPGLHILAPGPGSPAWHHLSPGDYRPRSTRWIRQITVHTTKGIWPKSARPDGPLFYTTDAGDLIRRGAGAGGRDRIVSEFWRGDPEHSAAQLVIDNDGSVACLCDLGLHAAYHATTVNDWSIGIEMYQESDGSIYEAVYQSAELLVSALCDRFWIARQLPSRAYNGTIIRRMIDGGPDMIGMFGHRDNAWDRKARTSTRGRGDPGDEIYRRLRARGFEGFDFDAREDIATWERRQQSLNALGEHLAVDGLAGPSTLQAMRRRGFASGRDIPIG